MGPISRFGQAVSAAHWRLVDHFHPKLRRVLRSFTFWCWDCWEKAVSPNGVEHHCDGEPVFSAEVEINKPEQ